MNFLNRKKIKVLLSFLVSVTSLSCNKTVFTDQKLPEAVPDSSVDHPPVISGAAPAKLPPNQKIKVTVQQFEPKAWFKVCMTAIVNNVDAKEVNIGCNKDKDIGNSQIEIAANKDQCNKITLVAKIAKPLETPAGCKRGSDDPKVACPYPDFSGFNWSVGDKSHWQRSTTNVSDLKFFKFFGNKNYKNNATPMNIDPEVRARLDKSNPENDMFLAKPGNSLIRIYLEDQTDDNFSAFSAGSKSPKDTGIDFQNFIVDVKGEGNARFMIEGSGVNCSAP